MDVPIGYFHARRKEGGLGRPASSAATPNLLFRRFSKLENSTSSAARAAFCHEWVQKRLEWAEKGAQAAGVRLDSGITSEGIGPIDLVVVFLFFGCFDG
jgi:hypothetical protein